MTFIYFSFFGTTFSNSFTLCAIYKNSNILLNFRNGDFNNFINMKSYLTNIKAYFRKYFVNNLVLGRRIPMNLTPTARHGIVGELPKWDCYGCTFLFFPSVFQRFFVSSSLAFPFFPVCFLFHLLVVFLSSIFYSMA